MPAKIHGRAGKIGRPKFGQSTFAEIALDTNINRAMRALAREAASRGLRLNELADKISCDPRSLSRSFHAAPRLETVERICRALQIRMVVGRALLRKLTPRDIENLPVEVSLTIVNRYGSVLKDAHRTANAVRDCLRNALPKEKERALEEFVIAEAGLHDSLVDPVRVPGLAALAATVQTSGLYLDMHIAPRARFGDNAREAYFAVTWLERVLHLSEKDEAILLKILKRYTGGIESPLKDMIANSFILDNIRLEYRRRRDELNSSQGGKA